jgi:uncharacterized membrane protein YeiH
MKHELLQLIDILGTVSFAVSGVFAAMQKKLDIFGILIISFITAIGGGTLRDMMIGDLPVSWMRNLNYTLIIFITAVVTIIFNKTIRNFEKTLFVFDSLGLGFFTVLGVQKGIAVGLHPIICIALGTITGCFGGVLRDISLNHIPMIFQKEIIYASACILGATTYFVLKYFNVESSWNDFICISTIFITRVIAVKFKLTLPTVHDNHE